MRRSLLAATLLVGACNAAEISFKDLSAGNKNPPVLATPEKTDRIVQVVKPQVDVLWVVDNSCSMSEEQVKLGKNFDAFIGFFVDSGLDWHIGLVSTDTEDKSQRGKLIEKGGYRYLTDETPNPVLLFSEMARLGTTGSFSEKGLLATQFALAAPNDAIRRANEGFYREDAALHIVIISDEDDQSAPQTNRFEFSNFLQNLKPDADTPVTFSSIVGPPPLGCSNADTEAAPAGVYQNVTRTVGGIFESICEEDWSGVLRELGLQAAGLRREYYLSEVPVPGTLQVWVEDEGRYNDGVDERLIVGTKKVGDVCRELGLTACFPYRYNAERNSVVMTDWVPSPRAEVFIRYQLLRGLQPEEDDEFLSTPGTTDTSGNAG
ncbi:MAG: hypothetical protein H6732_01205 [Alphaproteobacteria bacterium]|nr:hypothetical protein [Alphaproteobacteria bacterium]